MQHYNLSLATSRREVGEAVVAAVRERSGGLLGVAAMALPHEGGIEVGHGVLGQGSHFKEYVIISILDGLLNQRIHQAA